MGIGGCGAGTVSEAGSCCDDGRVINAAAWARTTMDAIVDRN